MAFDYTYPEVRQHRLDYIATTATNHDVDGYEPDFNRMGIQFPMGQGRQKAHLMTDLMRQIRERLNAIGEERGRPYTLAVHVMDSLETNLEIGLDVEAWAREGLVNVLPVGLGYMPDQLAIGQWVRLAGETGVQVYPSINPNTKGGPRRLFGVSLCSARKCGRTPTTIWDQGADRIYLFNFRHEPTQRINRGGVLRGAERVPRARDHGREGQSVRHQPPRRTAEGLSIMAPSRRFCRSIVLDWAERKLRLHLGPAAEDPTANMRLSVYTAKAGKGTIL